MKKIKYVLFIASLTMLIQCKESPCLKGSGDIITEQRELQDVSQLTIFDNMNVNLYIGNENKIEIRGGENVVPFITTVMDKGILTIRNENRCNFLRSFDNDLNINIWLTGLDAIEYYGSKDLIVHDTIKRGYFRFKSEGGTGSVYLKLDVKDYVEFQVIESLLDAHLEGQCYTMGFYNQGSSWVYAEDMFVKRMIMENKSTGDCIVNVDSVLTYSITNIGNILYYGNTRLSPFILTGKGRIIDMN